MSEYMFGTGPGHLNGRAECIAEKEGATLVNYTDAQCNCGYGCRPYTCKRSRRHWFTAPNRGEPFNGRIAQRVMRTLEAAASRRCSK